MIQKVGPSRAVDQVSMLSQKEMTSTCFLEEIWKGPFLNNKISKYLCRYLEYKGDSKMCIVTYVLCMRVIFVVDFVWITCKRSNVWLLYVSSRPAPSVWHK